MKHKETNKDRVRNTTNYDVGCCINVHETHCVPIFVICLPKKHYS